jgi:hypothetical protein
METRTVELAGGARWVNQSTASTLYDSLERQELQFADAPVQGTTPQVDASLYTRISAYIVAAIDSTLFVGVFALATIWALIGVRQMNFVELPRDSRFQFCCLISIFKTLANPCVSFVAA